MTVKDYMNIMECMAPESLACKWDHVGLMAGHPTHEVTGVLICMELSAHTVPEALDKGCNLVITHHPAIFHPLATLREDIRENTLLCEAVRNRIAVYSAHTNLDYAEDGVEESLVRILCTEEVLRTPDGQHFFGVLPRPLPLSDFIAHAATVLDTAPRTILPSGAGGVSDITVSQVGCACGAFDGEVSWMYETGCDILVTGEAKQSEIAALALENFPTLLCGHFATEYPGLVALAKRLPGRVFLSKFKSGDGILIMNQ